MRELIGDDVVLVIANLSAHDDITKAKAIIKDHGLEDISYFDINDDINKNFDIIGVPASIIIDPNGKIKDTAFGSETAESILIKINK